VYRIIAFFGVKNKGFFELLLKRLERTVYRGFEGVLKSKK
jgi:hypothetical protein